MKSYYCKLNLGANWLICLFLLLLFSCSASNKIKREISIQHSEWKSSEVAIDFDSLWLVLQPMSVQERESILLPMMLDGNIPRFLLDFKPLSFSYIDSTQRTWHAVIFVSPDYLSIGNDSRFMRIPLTPKIAQAVADQFHSVLPTTKMVNEIYHGAGIKQEPLPLTMARDSFKTFLHHHRMIETRLYGKSRKAKIIAGIKKDVVQSMQVLKSDKKNRVAIYGWHRLQHAKPIQPLYSGHVDWYVDYSHGIRLVYEKMLLNKKIVRVKAVLNDPLLRPILTDEKDGVYMRYE